MTGLDLELSSFLVLSETQKVFSVNLKWVQDLTPGFRSVTSELMGVLAHPVTLATTHVFHVDLQLFVAGRLADVARRVVGDAVAAAHRVVVVSVTQDVTHAAAHRNNTQAFILKDAGIHLIYRVRIACFYLLISCIFFINPTPTDYGLF